MKKKIIIMLIVLIVIGLIGSGGYFAYKEYKKQDPFELEWIRTYYDYMKTTNEKLKEKQAVLKYYREDEKIEFCKIENTKNPVMLYNYKELGEAFTTVFYISDNNKVYELKGFKKDLDVQYLYDIQEKKYNYYIHEVSGDEEKYYKISECIKANKINESIEENKESNEVNIDNVFTVKKGEVISVTTVDGETLEISKLEQKFIKTSMVEENWQYINFDSYEDGVKKDLSKAIKVMEKELNGKVIEEVAQKEAEIQSRKKKMVKAIEEIEENKRQEEERRKIEEETRKKVEEELRKQAEEEAKKKAEEEARIREEEQRAQAENPIELYTLNYGTYKGIDYWTAGDPLSKYEVTIELREDGTYTETRLITAGNMEETYTGTFSLIRQQGVGDTIRLSADNTSYKVTGNNEFTSKTGAIIRYSD